MPRIPAAPLRCLLAALLVALPACSRRAERLVGNERLIRGGGALGVTSDTTVVAGRDTWLETGTRKTAGAEVLVGSSGVSQAVALFKIRSWSLPADMTILIHQVALFAVAVSRDSVMPPPPLTVSLGESQAAWNESTVVWDDRGAAATLGQGDYLFGTDTLVVVLNLSSPLDSLKKWRKAPDSVPGFQLTGLSGGIAAFRSDAMWFRVTYEDTVSGKIDTTVIDTRIQSPLYLHAPFPGLATGGEDTLRLGGPEGTGLAIHLPIPPIPAGAAINAGELRVRVEAVTDSTPYLDHAASIDVEVREAGADWGETATGDGSLKPGSAIAIRRGFLYRGVSDSLLTIALPAATVRTWRASPATNRGILLTVARGKAWPALLVGSRESARPPTLRLTYTTAPGGRF